MREAKTFKHIAIKPLCNKWDVCAYECMLECTLRLHFTNTSCFKASEIVGPF